MNNSTDTIPSISLQNSIPNGYKKTAIGIIPENWEVKKLGDYLDYIQPTNYLNDDIVDLKDDENSIPVLTAGKSFILGYTKDDKKTFSNIPIILFDDFTTENKYVDFPFKVRSSAAKILAAKNDKFNFKFIYEALQQINYVSTNHKRYWISEYQFLKLPIPPLPEQQKIAEILSTWDEAITNCKNTINTLKARNKGLAQQLLTGKKRLSGFSDKWVELKTDKIFRNNTDKTHEGKLEILSATQERGVIPRSMNNIDIKYDASSLGTYKKVEKGDYVISLRSFQGGIEYSEYEGIVSPAYTILKEIIPISKTFFKVYFKTETFISKLNTIIYGIRDGKQISFKDFATLKLPCPSVEEQTAISLVLETADQELKSYQAKLATLQNQKKGLMQQLLTGKIRVKVN
jgi:type I restriction enzyme S subunit